MEGQKFKTLYIHIGAHKTATTAIQTFLFKNRHLLKNLGVLYPGVMIDHQEMAHELLDKKLCEIQGNPGSPTKRILAEIVNSPYKTYVVSSEDFCLLWDKVSNLRIMIPEDIHVKIVYYVRRQDDEFEAVYNELVRNPKRRISQKIDEFLGTGYLKIMDYEKVLSLWEEAFGCENIIVRCYEKQQLKNNIFSDFLDAIGIESGKEYHIPKKMVNPSFDWSTVEFMRVCNMYYRDDMAFLDFLLDYFDQYDIPLKHKTHLLSPLKRQKIIALYKTSNQNVARRYLGRNDGRLFYDPPPVPNECTHISARNEDDILISSRKIYEQYKQQNSVLRIHLRRFRKSRETYSYLEMLNIVIYQYIGIGLTQLNRLQGRIISKPLKK